MCREHDERNVLIMRVLPFVAGKQALSASLRRYRCAAFFRETARQMSGRATFAGDDAASPAPQSTLVHP